MMFPRHLASEWKYMTEISDCFQLQQLLHEEAFCLVKQLEGTGSAAGVPSMQEAGLKSGP